MPLAADLESTLGHYNKQRGPNAVCKVEGAEQLGRTTTLPALWGNNLDTVICLCYSGVRPTDTHTEEAGRPLQYLLCCYDTVLKELIECI